MRCTIDTPSSRDVGPLLCIEGALGIGGGILGLFTSNTSAWALYGALIGASVLPASLCVGGAAYGAYSLFNKCCKKPTNQPNTENIQETTASTDYQALV